MLDVKDESQQIGVSEDIFHAVNRVFGTPEVRAESIQYERRRRRGVCRASWDGAYGEHPVNITENLTIHHENAMRVAAFNSRQDRSAEDTFVSPPGYSPFYRVNLLRYESATDAPSGEANLPTETLSPRQRDVACATRDKLAMNRAPGSVSDGVTTVPMPQVDLELCQVRFNGVCYNVSPDGALLFSELVGAYPIAIAAYKLSTKPSRVKKSLPDTLKAMVSSKPGTGYTLVLPE